MANIIASGDWWTLDDDGLLSIFCVGDMPYYDYGDAPWYEYLASITSISIADSVTNISNDVFWNCDGLTSVTIPDSVTIIGSYSFDDCDNLTSVTIGNGVTHIGYNAFALCTGLTTVTIGNSVIEIGVSAFSGCENLISITIPDSVTYIEDGAFYGCDSLTTVTIGDGVTHIGYNAFDGCTSLSDVYYTGTEAQWGEIEIDEEGNAPLTSATIHYNYSPLSSIAVTTPPTKTAYIVGETFDPDGMVVTATYSNASTAAVTGYSVSPSGALTTSDRVITVSYTEGDVTATADVAITVRREPDLKLTFNDADLSKRLSTYRVTYETNYRKVVTALHGTEYFGNATRRPVITFTLFPMTDAQAKAIYDALKVMVASCTYTDPAIVGSSDASASRTAKFRVTSSLEAAFGLRSVDGNRYYKGGEIVLRGVTCLA